MTPREGSLDSLATSSSARCSQIVVSPDVNHGLATFRSPVSYSAEDSPSGRGRTLGKRVKGNLSGVQIPHPPPAQEGRAEIGRAHV